MLGHTRSTVLDYGEKTKKSIILSTFCLLRDDSVHIECHGIQVHSEVNARRFSLKS